ncbi:hypothetical protein B0A52_00960 [Exophiala mesophila]|uniref:Enoyl reductase (ER) domain-containing protein n=1 Tax=Exophiala mesophila TaxID=212818 RepID=A0A438NIP8_EXOME|nr:hypothetical protein B0A52_00960 [Exophiala mesophila]
MSDNPPKIPKTMRAWQFSSTRGGLEKHLKLNDSAPVPSHGGQKLLVRVLAAGINPADYKVAEMPIVGRFIFGKNSTPGMDFAGVVADPGDSSSAFKEGQRVFGRMHGITEGGSLAEYVAVDRTGVALIPDGVKAEQAAGVGTAGLTAYQTIVPNVKPGTGARIFINGGSGGTGVWSIQIAKALGCHVVTTCSGANAQFCKNLGADEVIDYRTTDVVKSLKAMADESKQGHQFDLVVDNVGTQGQLYWQSHHYLSKIGRYVQIGADTSVSATWGLIMKLVWPKFLGGGKRKFQFHSVTTQADQLAEIGNWLQQGKVQTPIHNNEVVPFEDAVKAFTTLKSHRTTGKIVIQVSEE